MKGFTAQKLRVSAHFGRCWCSRTLFIPFKFLKNMKPIRTLSSDGAAATTTPQALQTKFRTVQLSKGKQSVRVEKRGCRVMDVSAQLGSLMLFTSQQNRK